MPILAVLACYRGVVGAASGAGIAIGVYFAFYGAATNLLVRHTEMKRGQVAFVAGAAAATGGSVVKVPLAVCIRCSNMCLRLMFGMVQPDFLLHATKLRVGSCTYRFKM